MTNSFPIDRMQSTEYRVLDFLINIRYKIMMPVIVFLLLISLGVSLVRNLANLDLHKGLLI